MCGLVGIAGNISLKEEMFMKRLLVLDYFRGTDSTGLAAIRENGSTNLAKAAVNPLTFFDMKTFETALNGYQSKVFLGHNRAATLGKVNDANAHPYQYGEITGAHNGTLDRTSWQRLEHESGTVTNTDSAAVFACINEIGIDATIPLMEKGRTSQTGAWALTYYNKVNDTMCFIRNSHRPLWYGFSKDRKRMYWASEWEFLDAAGKMAKRGEWDGWYSDEEGYNFFPFAEDRLYEVKVDDLKDGLSQSEIKKLAGRKLEGREPAPLVQTKPSATKSGGGTPWEKKPPTNGGTTTTTSKPSSNVVGIGHNGGDLLDEDIADFVARRNFQVKTEERSSEHPLNGLISEDRFKELARYGCSYCSADIDIDDVGYTIYDNEDCILCPDCSKHDSGNIKIYLGMPN